MILLFGMWAGIAVLVYIYFGYPLFLLLLTRKKTESCQPVASEMPSVGIFCAAYNEAAVIREKICNFRSLDYPRDKLRLYIASDGSTDGTNELVQDEAAVDGRISLFAVPRQGKAAAINEGVPNVSEDLIVFTDANTSFDRSAIRFLVRHFMDPQTGCVSGKLIYNNPGKNLSGEGEGAYWRYETSLKKMESRLGYVAGANGAIYAIRKELFEPLPRATINDDFLISMRIVAKGFKSLFDGDAIAWEDVAPDDGSEFQRHVRDGAGHYLAVLHLLPLLNPLCGRRFIIYFSHRILRWLAPVLLILAFVSNAVLASHPTYAFLFLAQVIFYGLALCGAIIKNGKHLPFLFFVPYYFCNLNLALLFGFFRAVTGTQKTSWIPAHTGGTASLTS